VLVNAVVVMEGVDADADRFEADVKEGVGTALCATVPVWALVAVRAARLIAWPIAMNENTLNTAVSLRAREAACRARRF
jgi:hypothetical protein